MPKAESLILDLCETAAFLGALFLKSSLVSWFGLSRILEEGSPWWPSGWDFLFQCRECGFSLWLGSWNPTCLAAKKPKHKAEVILLQIQWRIKKKKKEFWKSQDAPREWSKIPQDPPRAGSAVFFTDIPLQPSIVQGRCSINSCGINRCYREKIWVWDNG